MKLALCLSGQPRSYKQAFEYINKNLLQHFDVDVFFHTWVNEPAKSFIYEDLYQLYKPVIASYDYSLPGNVNSHMRVANGSHPANFCTSMFYSINLANEYRTKHETFGAFRYDYVIRSRFDFALNKVIDFHSLEKNKVYVSKDVEGPSLLNDQFAIADSDTMNCYASTFQFLNYHHKNGVVLCGHEMLQEQLNKFSIPVEKLDLNHPFVDGNFNRGRHSLIRNDMSEWIDVKIWGY
jgi:hypothetical protein